MVKSHTDSPSQGRESKAIDAHRDKVIYLTALSCCAWWAAIAGSAPWEKRLHLSNFGISSYTLFKTSAGDIVHHKEHAPFTFTSAPNVKPPSALSSEIVCLWGPCSHQQTANLKADKLFLLSPAGSGGRGTFVSEGIRWHLLLGNYIEFENGCALDNRKEPRKCQEKAGFVFISNTPSPASCLHGGQPDAYGRSANRTWKLSLSTVVAH